MTDPTRPESAGTESADTEAESAATDAELPGEDDDRVEARAHLLPEETAAGGSDDAERQAQIILEDSDRRTAEPEATKLESTQTPDRS